MSGGNAESEARERAEEVRRLLQDLAEDDEVVQRLAFQDITDEMEDDLATELLRLVRESDDTPLRARAVISLGPTLELCDDELSDDGELYDDDEFSSAPLSSSCYHAVVKQLRKIYHDAEVPKLVRRRVLEAAVRSPQPWQEGAVRAAYRSGDEDWQVTAVFCMGFLSGFEQDIVDAFHTGAEDVRLEAVSAAGRRAFRELGPEILALAADETAAPRFRFAAIDAVAEINPPGALEALQRLHHQDAGEISEAAGAALEELVLWQGLGGGWDDD